MNQMDEEFVKATCRPGTAECCRYLCMGPGGWVCAKLDGTARRTIDRRSAAGKMHAKGDNCPGVLSLKQD